ncbi:DJ-1/PfpI family protein [Nocardiopsis sp. HNM0947]|uniref:DJ-1/PfpI family protein n=1 Tax=Nocardiopsis coralli TaxID=2772213 RepID=A0ABR9P2V0_9ACTN|nr:DJ-1/PfpI family protein [Nocardiopsis coralli]MBE2998166.1 DJ-1/PfpI family protein [Nocardiopsis coralli]
MRAQVVLFDGFDPMDAVAPYEVLYAGGTASGGALEVELVSAEGAREVPSGNGMTVWATAALDPGAADVVVLPGAVGAMPDPASEEVDENSIPAILGRTLTTALPGLIGEVLERPGALLATVCGGSLVPAMAGLIEGRRATTHHMGADFLEATGTVHVDARVVDDGDLVTAAGVTSGLDLGLYLLERELGPRIALSVERLFAHERRGVVWRAEGLEPVS